MPVSFWLRRTLVVFSSVLVILFIVELLKGHEPLDGALFALLWSSLSTSVFIATRLYYSRKGVACELCQDTPENGHDNKQ